MDKKKVNFPKIIGGEKQILALGIKRNSKTRTGFTAIEAGYDRKDKKPGGKNENKELQEDAHHNSIKNATFTTRKSKITRRRTEKLDLSARSNESLPKKQIFIKKVEEITADESAVSRRRIRQGARER